MGFGPRAVGNGGAGGAASIVIDGYHVVFEADIRDYFGSHRP